MESNILFLICVALQALTFFIDTIRIKMWLFIFAALTSLILCFISPAGFLWIIVTILCSINTFINYKKMKSDSDLPTFKF